MRKDRLLKLADYLETVPRGQFDMEQWDTRWPGEATKPCGFAGCAVGWAAHARLFRCLDFKEKVPRYREPGKRSVFGWKAVNRVFGLTGDCTAWDGSKDAVHLFSERSYDPPWGKVTTPKQVARRIRKFVKDNGS